MFDSDGGGVVDGASFSEVAPVTNPPPPGNWGPPQPPYNQGQPPYGPGQWPPQQSWGQPPAPPKNNGLKWLLAGVAVLLVIAISVGATLLFTRDGEDEPTNATNGNPPATGDIASANDTGPVSIITEDPTCDPWRPIASTLSRQQNQGWESRDPSIPAASWSTEEKALHESVAAAMERAANQTLALAKQTPHRAMRELYKQSIAFWRAYSNSVPEYSAIDNELARAANAASNAITSICTAIDNRAASARASLIDPAEKPTSLSDATNSDDPSIFIDAQQKSICNEWLAMADKFDTNTSDWLNLDPNIEASEWTPEQQRTMDSMAPVMNRYADDIETLGRSSRNPTFEDIATLSAQYWRAFAKAIPSYTTADSYISGAASSSSFVIYDACLGLKG